MRNIFLIIFSLFIVSSVNAEETIRPYITAQSMGGYPMGGIGFRTPNLDVCAVVYPPVPAIFHVKAQYLFHPLRNRGYYIGTGLGVLQELELIQLTGSLEASIGYAWYTPRNKVLIFVEANGTMPFKNPGRSWPGVSVGVGF